MPIRTVYNYKNKLSIILINQLLYENEIYFLLHILSPCKSPRHIPNLNISVWTITFGV